MEVFIQLESQTIIHQGYLAIYMKMARVKKIERQKMFDFITCIYMQVQYQENSKNH